MTERGCLRVGWLSSFDIRHSTSVLLPLLGTTAVNPREAAVVGEVGASARAMRTVVKVYLLDVNDGPEAGRRLFYAGPPSDEDEYGGEAAVAGGRGLRGWVEERYRRLEDGWKRSQTSAARLSRRVWERLHRATHPDETLLARLYSARAIDVHHPASLTAEEALTAWLAFLSKANRRHWPWFVVNVLVAPLTVLLAPLPGPNLVGYWFAYRAVRHGLILIGLGRARSGRVETRLRPSAVLDRPIPRTGPGPDHDVDHLAPLGCQPKHVDEFLKRHGGSPPVPAAGQAGGSVL
jgi:hypothetical protein